MNEQMRPKECPEEILIVEDSPTQAEQLRHLLEQQHYRVTVAGDGAQALLALKVRKPALVLSDIVMPEMDGYELCKRIKADPGTSEIPVILLTTLSNAHDVLEGLACGADSFITKPFNRDYLAAHITRFLTINKMPRGERISIRVDLPQANKSLSLNVDPQRMLTLLLSSYEAAVQRGLELSKTQDELNSLNERLEELVEELTAEIASRKKANRMVVKILESVDEGFVIVDRDFRILTVNRSFAEKAGLSIEEVCGKHCYEMSHQRSSRCSDNGEDCAVEHVFRTGQPYTSVHDHYDSKGQRSLFIETKAYPFTVDSSGAVTEVLETHIDVTERKLYEESLRKTTAELKRIDEMKTNFIAIASHELRTPLTSIKNAVDLLVKRKAGPISDTQERFLRMAEKNTSLLSALINDLLDVSKMEAGKMELHRGKIDLGAVVGRVANMLKPLADGKSISLRQVCSTDFPFAFADEHRTEQVLINLVGNALKFTPNSGSVVIDIHPARSIPEDGEKEKKYLEIAVADSGRGIPEEYQQHLFEKFYQAESSLNRDQAGTGLGLVITKGIVEAHGGKIWFESTVGSGTTFYFTLPAFDDRTNALHLLESALVLAKSKQSPLSVVLLRPADPGGGGDGCKTLQERVAAGLFRSDDHVFVVPLDKAVALILPDMDRAATERSLPRIRQDLLSGPTPGEKGLSMSIHAVVTYPEDGTTAEELLANAQKTADGR